jgi:hypothetical protein
MHMFEKLLQENKAWSNKTKSADPCFFERSAQGQINEHWSYRL